MLVNTQTIVPLLYQVLKAMEESHFEFFLTGSRYFGGYHEGSDYDFFVMESTGVSEWLRAKGFTLDTNAAYDDPTFSKVLQLTLDDGIIQVQLIVPEEYKRKQIVQRLLRNRYGNGGLPGDKIAKRELWLLTYSVVKDLGISDFGIANSVI